MPPRGARREFSVLEPSLPGSPRPLVPANDISANALTDAEAQWRRQAFFQGVHHRNWAKGHRLDDALNLAAELGLRHSDDVYRGRDGRHYQMTELRRHYLLREPVTGGSAWEAMGRATEKALPQALEWMARDDRAPAQSKPAMRDDRAPANENRSGAAAKPVPPAGPVLYGRGPANDDKPHPGRRDIGVGERLREALGEADDLVRLGAAGATLGGADHVAAAGNALGSLATGGDFAAAYRKNLAEERARTQAARQRMGVLGAVAETSPTFAPGYGDALGLLGDAKYFAENPDERTPGNLALSAVGLIPGIPAFAGMVKKIDKADEAAGIARKAPRIAREWEAELFEAQRHPLTESEIRKLPPGMTGLIFVQEKKLDNLKAREFQESAQGAFFHNDGKSMLVPGLVYTNSNSRGVNAIKFDAAEISGDGVHLIMKDVKTKMVLGWEAPESKALDAFRRIKQALKQNEGFKVAYEFTDEKAVSEATDFLRKKGFDKLISVRVRKP